MINLGIYINMPYMFDNEGTTQRWGCPVVEQSTSSNSSPKKKKVGIFPHGNFNIWESPRACFWILYSHRRTFDSIFDSISDENASGSCESAESSYLANSGNPVYLVNLQNPVISRIRRIPFDYSANLQKKKTNKKKNSISYPTSTLTTSPPSCPPSPPCTPPQTSTVTPKDALVLLFYLLQWQEEGGLEIKWVKRIGRDTLWMVKTKKSYQVNGDIYINMIEEVYCDDLRAYLQYFELIKGSMYFR